jgi:hypothetical protein
VAADRSDVADADDRTSMLSEDRGGAIHDGDRLRWRRTPEIETKLSTATLKILCTERVAGIEDDDDDSATSERGQGSRTEND